MVALLVGGCAATWRQTPQEMDAMHRRCVEKAALEYNGAVPRTKAIGFRSTTPPPGTPVVIYGTSWCKGCKRAAQYLAYRGIPHVELDVEDDPKARAAMVDALRDAALPVDEIFPTIDSRGTVTRGFSPCAVELSWAAR